MHIEDQAFPKRCGHLDGKTVVPAGGFVEKVHAAVEARTDPEPTPMSDDLRSPGALFDTVGLRGWLAASDRFAGDRD